MLELAQLGLLTADWSVFKWYINKNQCLFILWLYIWHLWRWPDCVSFNFYHMAATPYLPFHQLKCKFHKKCKVCIKIHFKVRLWFNPTSGPFLILFICILNGLFFGETFEKQSNWIELTLNVNEWWQLSKKQSAFLFNNNS